MLHHRILSVGLLGLTVNVWEEFEGWDSFGNLTFFITGVSAQYNMHSTVSRLADAQPPPSPQAVREHKKHSNIHKQTSLFISYTTSH